MRHKDRVHRRGALYGWVKWFPVVFIPFVVLFSDAWFTVNTRTNDYEYSRLSQEYRDTAELLHEVRASLAELQRMPLLVSKGEALGFVIPNPRQVETLYYTPQELSIDPEWPLLLARMEEAERRNAAWRAPGELVSYSELWLSDRGTSEGISSGGAAMLTLKGADPVEDFDSEPMTTPVILQIPREVFMDEPSLEGSVSDLLGRL